MRSRRSRRILGSVLLTLFPAFLLALILQGAVRRPLGRTFETITSDWFAGSEGDLRLPLASTDGVTVGHPVFRAAHADGLEPVAHVTKVESGAACLRFAPGSAPGGEGGSWRLVAWPAPSGLADAWEVAVPPETAAELGRKLSDRLGRVLEEVVFPDLERRLPAFLGRIDPRTDPRAREVFDTVGNEVAERLQPFLDDLAGRIARDLETHFDLLDRLGLLWTVVRGDAEGLERKLRPVAERSVATWWSENRDRVLTVVGEGVNAQAPVWQTWFGHEAWSAAREELVEPLLASHRARLEKEAEGAIRDVLDAVVDAPGGGFRTRFAAMLRSHLLEKDEPLLLLERLP